jgi:hypothetical protein
LITGYSNSVVACGSTFNTLRAFPFLKDLIACNISDFDNT